MKRQRTGRLLALALGVTMAASVGTPNPAQAAPVAPTGTKYISDLDWTSSSSDFGSPKKDKSQGGGPLTIKGVTYPKGVGIHATGQVSVNLGANCTSFSSRVGINDQAKTTPPGTDSGTVKFQVWGDGKLLKETGVVRSWQDPIDLSADVTNVTTLKIVADKADGDINFDHADFIDALVVCNDTLPPEPGINQTWDLAGPGVIAGTLVLNDKGQLDLQAKRDGKLTVTGQQLGLTDGASDFTKGLTFVSKSDQVVKSSYSMTTGKRAKRTYTHNETRFTFKNEAGKQIVLTVRLSADGIAYRYNLGAGAHSVSDESASWAFATDAQAWMQKKYDYNYESDWMQTTLAAGGEESSVGYPVLAAGDGDTRVLLTESNLHGNYSGSHLIHTKGSLAYGIDLFKGQAVTWEGDTPTPWRVAIIGNTAGVVESTLVDDLATPAELTDTSWVKPGISSWSWLTDWNSPRDEARQRDFVDLSARNGWEYVLLDEGWNESWVPRTVRYAHSRGVDVIIWFHSRDLMTQEQRDRWLPKIASWGVSGIKVDFMDSDSQSIHKWYDDIAADTAKYKLMINFHGAALPTGLQRTWPHIMSYEAIRGAENGIEPVRTLMAPFARNVVGSMDWTPGTFSRGNGNSSVAQETAMSVVFESGWQHLSDKPEGYAAQPDAEKMLSNVVAGPWSDTKLLSGTPASDIVLAREYADKWFVGGMKATTDGTLKLPLSRIASGDVIVDLLADAPGNNSKTVLTSKVHKASDEISVPVNANGGFLAIACPATAGKTTCLEAPEKVAEATLNVVPESLTIPQGTTGTFAVDFTAAAGAKDVTVSFDLPEGWKIEGGPATTAELAAGKKLTTNWRLTVPKGAKSGTVEVPATATFTSPDGSKYSRYDELAVSLPLDGTNYISDLPWTDEANGWGPIERDMSNNNNSAKDGYPLKINGTVYEKGVGMHAPAELSVDLGGVCTSFEAYVGIDDEIVDHPDSGGAGHGTVKFQVWGDGKLLTETAVIETGQDAFPIKLDNIAGVKVLRLVADQATNGKNHDHADWGDAKVICSSTPADTTAPVVEKVADVLVKVGEPVSVSIKASDESLPLAFAAQGLPEGVSIDAASGVISGKPVKAGVNAVKVTVTDAAENATSIGFTLTVEAKPGPEPTPTVTPTVTPSVKPTVTPTAKPTSTATAKPTATQPAKPGKPRPGVPSTGA